MTSSDRARDTSPTGTASVAAALAQQRADAVRDRLVGVVDDERIGVHGLHVRVGGATAAHAWTPDERRDIHSIAKGVCVLAAGIAADEGRFDVDAPIARFLPDLVTGDGVGDVTVRRLLTMTSGIDLPWSPTLMTDWPDLAAEFVGRPSRGAVFQYSNASTYTAMRALATVVGDVGEWLRSRLFEPLGIDAAVWDRCPNGHIVAGGGLWLRLDELSRLGRLIRDRGVWQGRSLVAPRWVDGMHSDWVVSGVNPGYDRYALAGWAGPGDAWRLHGAYGQLLVFAGDAVVAVAADDHPGGDRIAAVAAEALGATGPYARPA